MKKFKIKSILPSWQLRFWKEKVMNYLITHQRDYRVNSYLINQSNK